MDYTILEHKIVGLVGLLMIRIITAIWFSVSSSQTLIPFILTAMLEEVLSFSFGVDRVIHYRVITSILALEGFLGNKFSIHFVCFTVMEVILKMEAQEISNYVGR